MKLKLLRTKLLGTHTIGQLYVEGNFLCFTLEDVVREVVGKPVESWKIKRETAIPSGEYAVVFEHSPRFGANTLTLKNVPGFSKIRIHSGNNALDTEGCILVGYRLTDRNLIHPGTSRPALRDLKEKIGQSPTTIVINSPTIV